jgi:nitroreductase
MGMSDEKGPDERPDERPDEKRPCHHGQDEQQPAESRYPNETLRLLCERASLRDFEDRPVPSDVLESVFSAGLHAASGGNLQPLSILTIEDPKRRRELANRCDQPFMARAPVHLLFLIDWRRLERWAALEEAPFTATSSFQHFWISFQDVVISAQNICTAIDSLGLGSVYIGTILDFLPDLREMFALPDGVFPVVLLCLGYPRTHPKPRTKLRMSLVVHHERYVESTDEELLAGYREKYGEVRIPITDEALRTYEKTCRRSHGADFAAGALERVKERGAFNAVQRYFGLHYRADELPQGNDEYQRIMEQFGFHWFRKWEPQESE